MKCAQLVPDHNILYAFNSSVTQRTCSASRLHSARALFNRRAPLRISILPRYRKFFSSGSFCASIWLLLHLSPRWPRVSNAFVKATHSTEHCDETCTSALLCSKLSSYTCYCLTLILRIHLYLVLLGPLSDGLTATLHLLSASFVINVIYTLCYTPLSC